MMTIEQLSDADLNAYVDGELDQRTLAEMESWLVSHPQEAARVEAYRRQNEQLHNLYDSILDEPTPSHLIDLVKDPHLRTVKPVWMRIAASLVLLAVGAASGWGLHGMQSTALVDGTPDYVERAIGAHLVYTAEVLHPVEVAANQEGHLVAWLSKRLGHPIKAPHLGSVGYQLIGGRLLEEHGLPAAQFMYEDKGGRRVTVYVRANQGKDTAFKFTGEDGLSAFYWIDAPFAYALTGDIPRSDLLNVAHLVYKELAP